VGAIVIAIVTTAGMVSTTWVQFIKGSLLVVLCAIITVPLLVWEITATPTDSRGRPRHIAARGVTADQLPGTVLPEAGAWKGKPYVRVQSAAGLVSVWRKEAESTLPETQSPAAQSDGRKRVNGLPRGKGAGEADLYPVGYASALPGGATRTGSLSPFGFIKTMQDSEVVLWANDTIADADGTVTTVYFQKPTKGTDFMAPGSSPTFKKVRTARIAAVCVGVVAIALGIPFAKMNANLLVGWAFNIAASANLPALMPLLFWKRTTKQGISVAIMVGMLASLGWILPSAQAYKDVYGLDPARAIVPFSQPAIVTIPLGFLVLVLVSLLTQPKPSSSAAPVAAGQG